MELQVRERAKDRNKKKFGVSREFCNDHTVHQFLPTMLYTQVTPTTQFLINILTNFRTAEQEILSEKSTLYSSESCLSQTSIKYCPSATANKYQNHMPCFTLKRFAQIKVCAVHLRQCTHARCVHLHTPHDFHLETYLLLHRYSDACVSIISSTCLVANE